jgi:hypothetical protein
MCLEFIEADKHVEFGRVNTFVACGWTKSIIDYMLKRATSHMVWNGCYSLVAFEICHSTTKSVTVIM